MTGALAGAFLGKEAIPTPLLDRLEDGVKGRSYLTRLATKMYEVHVGSPITGS